MSSDCHKGGRDVKTIMHLFIKYCNLEMSLSQTYMKIFTNELENLLF